MSEVIYRKYRPKSFKEVVGQKPIKITLENEIVSGNLAHAYLFVGPRGIGKTTLARLFARSLNCLNRKDKKAEPCNECEACQMIMSGRSMDIIEIDAASNTGVDNVRDNIIANAQIPPFNNKGFKVFVIDEVHMLSKSAFNALLKTLEEPPQRVIFILATTEIHKVPETIISRCQRFDLKKIPVKEIVQRLSEIIEWEKVSVPENILAEIARRSEGSLRDAESLLGQVISVSGGKVTDEMASLVLPRSNWKEIDVLVESLRVHNLSTALNQINKLVDEGIDLDVFTNDFIDYLRQIMLYQIIGPTFTLDFDDNLSNSIKKHAQDFPLDDLSGFLNIILDKLSIKESTIEQLPLELACVEFMLDKTPTDTVSESKPEKTVESKPKSASANINDNEALKKIANNWGRLVEETKSLNHSISSLLLTSHPLEIKNKTLIVGLEFDFHKEQLDKPQVKNHISGILSDIVATNLSVDFTVDENFKDNHQQFKGKGESGVGDALDTFGGEVM